MIYAYARVSATDQNLNRQIDSFIQYGVAKEHVYCDKKSGKDFDRKGYNRLLKKLKKDDLLIIKSIDRLGRNYEKIIAQWVHITENIGANILVLDMPILDTRTNDNGLTGKLISNIVLQILSYVAQKEREEINARQKEGIASAKLRGIRFGRPNLALSEEFLQLVELYKSGEITVKEILKRTGLKKSTFYYRMSLIETRLENSIA
ncbi:MAG: recombinase family protein [Clostridia bacterium]|nr:recombinase family protein [Clostridia bacterium]